MAGRGIFFRLLTLLSNGIIVYSGPSRFDNEPIVVIITNIRRKSENTKTGDMLQSWIIRSDVSPVDAIKTGQDYSICKDCSFRGGETTKRSCYVNVGQAPLSVFRAYKKGSYIDLSRNPEEVAKVIKSTGKPLRIGAYGDPASVPEPEQFWNTLVHSSSGSTGYTQQWRDIHGLRRILMASTKDINETLYAHSIGWRTFRTANNRVKSIEVTCPASKEAGKKTSCEDCLLCNGYSKAKSIVIRPHGVGKKYVDCTGRGSYAHTG
jgi:hypothetical protein